MIAGEHGKTRNAERKTDPVTRQGFLGTVAVEETARTTCPPRMKRSRRDHASVPPFFVPTIIIFEITIYK